MKTENEEKLEKRIEKLNKEIEQSTEILDNLKIYKKYLTIGSITFFTFPILYGVGLSLVKEQYVTLEPLISYGLIGFLGSSPFTYALVHQNAGYHNRKIKKYINELHGYALEDNQKYDQKIKKK